MLRKTSQISEHVEFGVFRLEMVNLYKSFLKITMDLTKLPLNRGTLCIHLFIFLRNIYLLI